MLYKIICQYLQDAHASGYMEVAHSIMFDFCFFTTTKFSIRVLDQSVVHFASFGVVILFAADSCWLVVFKKLLF